MAAQPLGCPNAQATHSKRQQYKIVVEYWQGEGKGNVRLRAGNFERFDIASLINRISDADAIIYVGGISPQLEGEEMRVDFPGFNGGDRTINIITANTNRCTQVIACNRKAGDFCNDDRKRYCHYPGKMKISRLSSMHGMAGKVAGTAVADVLFGDYNPAGRLPITFYKSDSDLPDFNSYDMTGRTYRYFKGEALYPFGYGLSYTTFKYENLSVPASMKAGSKLTVSVKVTNSGKLNGDEVVQLYVSQQNPNIHAPLKALKGFKRISLKAGESRMISFQLTPEDLSVPDENGSSTQLKGKISISIGGGQPGIKNRTTSNVVSKTISVL